MLVQPDTNSAETSGNKAINGVHQDRLDIVIIGAGIGGLTAAIFLRKQGHRISHNAQTSWEPLSTLRQIAMEFSDESESMQKSMAQTP